MSPASSQLSWRRSRSYMSSSDLSVQYSLRPLESFCSSFSMPYFPVHCCQTTNWLIIVLTLINASTAFRAFSNSSFASTNLTIPCVGALSDDIACSPAVAALSLGEYYPEDTLSRTWTANCGQALALYENKVIAACCKQTWKGYGDTDIYGNPAKSVEPSEYSSPRHWVSRAKLKLRSSMVAAII